MDTNQNQKIADLKLFKETTEVTYFYTQEGIEILERLNKNLYNLENDLNLSLDASTIEELLKEKSDRGELLNPNYYLLSLSELNAHNSNEKPLEGLDQFNDGVIELLLDDDLILRKTNDTLFDYLMENIGVPPKDNSRGQSINQLGYIVSEILSSMVNDPYFIENIKLYVYDNTGERDIDVEKPAFILQLSRQLINKVNKD